MSDFHRLWINKVDNLQTRDGIHLGDFCTGLCAKLTKKILEKPKNRSKVLRLRLKVR